LLVSSCAGTSISSGGKAFPRDNPSEDALEWDFMYRYHKGIAEVEGIAEWGKGHYFLELAYEHFHDGNYKTSLLACKAALDEFRKSGNISYEIRALYLRGRLYEAQGRYEEASSFYDLAVTRAHDGGNKLQEADIYISIGPFYEMQGQYEKALTFYNQALARAREADAVLPPPSNFFYAPGVPGQDEKAMRECIRNAKNINVKKYKVTARALYNIGRVHEVQLRYGEALMQYQQALNTLRPALQDQNLADFLIWNRINGRHGLIMGDTLEATLLQSIGGVYEVQRQYGEALTYYQDALTAAQTERFGNGCGPSVIVKTNDASTRVIRSNLPTREELGGYRTQEANILRTIGRMYTAQEEYEAAVTHLEQALALFQQIKYPIGEASTRADLGRLYQQQKEYSKAQKYLEDAVAIYDKVRQGAGSDRTRSDFIAQYNSTYRTLIRNSLRLCQDEQAFLTSEQGRARTFLDQINSGMVMLDGEGVRELVQQEDTLSLQLLSIDKERVSLQGQPGVEPGRLTELNDRRAQTQKAYKAARQRLDNFHEELALQASGKPLSVRDIQQLLPADTTLLSYFVLDDTTIAAFLLTHSQYDVVELSVESSTVIDIIGEFRRFADRFLGNDAKAYLKLLVPLHESLITPLLTKLTTSNLIIVPNRFLHYIPFAVLTDGTTYLGDRFLLTTLPSASTLPFIIEHRKSSATSPSLLIFGNPTPARADLRLLEWAECEAKNIAKLYGVIPLLRDAATKQTLLDQASHASIVHLAAHGVLNEDKPLESFIALSPDIDHGDRPSDGLLTVREVYTKVHLPQADLVVLSACKTNVGKISTGDEMVGLTRAFLYSGTPSVLSTLWSVDDRATGLLMEHFYTGLQNGLSKVAALQKAQQIVRKEYYSHPYYWGAFVLTGDGGREQTSPKSPRSSTRLVNPSTLCR
jgi:CHAT domain-containing protein